MIDYLSQHLWQFWAVVAVLCLILELTAGDFFIMCFSIGAAFACGAAAVGAGFYTQLVFFAVFTYIFVTLSVSTFLDRSSWQGSGDDQSRWLWTCTDRW